jgi:hypothetical protein
MVGGEIVADIPVPGACPACGRTLPPQEGKGRRRLYCDARCRSAARRERARKEHAVKQGLTVNHRHEYLDTTDSKDSRDSRDSKDGKDGKDGPASADNADNPDDLVAARALAAARHLAAELSHPSAPQGAVTAARELSAAAETALQTAVDRARAAGQSWRDIGEVLGTSRQAAFQRFGHPVDPRTGAPMSREIPPGAADRAVAIFDWHDQGRWQEILDELDDAMRALHDQARLSRGWAAMVGMFGRLERIGEPSARRVADDTVVDVPLHFEAGDARGIVRFSGDGKIAGMGIRPASRAPERN